MKQDLPLTAQDRLAIADALYRFAAGQDLRDPALLSSALSRDAELDFVQPARRLGAQIAPYRGRVEILGALRRALAAADTTHTVSALRIEPDGAAASLFALAEVQHAARADRSRRLLLKSFYWLTLERAGARWTIRRMRVNSAWHLGDPGVLFPKPAARFASSRQRRSACPAA
ncbi:MAG TPA: nuclear transport factor 2 family protein [Burkholderiales bacterium]